MAGTVTSCSYSGVTLVHLLCLVLILLHLLLGVVPLATGYIHHVSTFFKFIFCPNTTFHNVSLPSNNLSLPSNNSSLHYINVSLPSTNISCSAMELLLTQMVVPYMQAINLILLISNTVLLTCGLYSLWCNITYIVIQTVTALQVVAIGCFVILQQPIRVEVSMHFPQHPIVKTDVIIRW